MPNQIQNFLNGIPLVTRILFLSVCTVPLLGIFVHPSLLVFIPKMVWNFELWRLFTCFFYHGLGLNWLFYTYMLYTYSLDVEQQKYLGDKAAYLFFLMFVFVFGLGLGYAFELIFLSEYLLLSIVYLWSKHNAERQVTFLFGIQFRGEYLPYALLGLEFLQTKMFPVQGALGLVCGHTFNYLAHQSAETNNGTPLIHPPAFLYRYFPLQRQQQQNQGFEAHAPRFRGRAYRTNE